MGVLAMILSRLESYERLQIVFWVCFYCHHCIEMGYLDWQESLSVDYCPGYLWYFYAEIWQCRGMDDLRVPAHL